MQELPDLSGNLGLYVSFLPSELEVLVSSDGKAIREDEDRVKRAIY